MTVLPDTVRIEYSSCAVNASTYSARYMMDSIDTVKQTDCALAFMIDSFSDVILNVTRYTEQTTPHQLTAGSGLVNGDVSVGKYVDVQLFVGGTALDEVEAALIKIYYRHSDLDVNNNGLLNDTMDINETTLVIYHFNESTWVYTRLSLDLDWVHAMGVNTTDTEVYGELYAGYIWARVTRISLFAVGGNVNTWSLLDQPVLLIVITISVIAGTMALVVLFLKRRRQ